jgi:hypothetical protein
MKIIGFSQLRNELSKGNLEHWFQCMDICDYIYIFDQASDDGSHDIYAQHDNVVLIQSEENRFHEELICKKELLDKILSDHPDTDWIFWMDGDTMIDQLLMDNDYEIMRDMLEVSTKHGADGIRLGHYNLWRSNKHYRLDSGYHKFDEWGRVPFWRNNGNLSFPEDKGLHGHQEPIGIQDIVDARKFKLIHYGFSTDQQIMDRYKLYKGLGQKGWDLDRLICEKDLATQEAEEFTLPIFIDSDTPDPTTLKPLKEMYDE